MTRALALLALLALLLVPSLAVAQSPSAPIIKTANFQVGAVANANGATLDTSQSAITTIQIICTVTCSGGTLFNFEASNDNSNWTSIFCAKIAATNPITGVTMIANLATTASDYVRCNTAGMALLRVRISAYSAGTATVTGIATSLPNGSGNTLAN